MATEIKIVVESREAMRRLDALTKELDEAEKEAEGLEKTIRRTSRARPTGPATTRAGTPQAGGGGLGQVGIQLAILAATVQSVKTVVEVVAKKIQEIPGLKGTGQEVEAVLDQATQKFASAVVGQVGSFRAAKEAAIPLTRAGVRLDPSQVNELRKAFQEDTARQFVESQRELSKTGAATFDFFTGLVGMGSTK